MIAFVKRLFIVGGGFLSTLILVFNVLRREGIEGIKWRLNAARRMHYIDNLPSGVAGIRTDYNKGYEKWIKRNEAHRAQVPEFGMLISVLMPIYKPSLICLKKAIDSVINQSYGHWELCLVDDASDDADLSEILRQRAAADSRIKLLTRSSNGHISVATNDALRLASGEYVALLDQDDELHLDALARVAQALLDRPDAEIVYSDEDKLDEKGRRHHPNFKPKFNPTLFLAQNMICHLGVYRTKTLREIGGFCVGLEGAQDWDLAWRVIESKGADKVVHIPQVLYHWREVAGSTARGVDEKSYASSAQLKAVQSHLSRVGRAALVTASERVPGMVRVRFTLPNPVPLVSIVIPTRDRKDLLELCVESLLNKTAYPNYEVIVVDNGSKAPDALAYLSELRQIPQMKVIEANIPFNFSRLNNLGVAMARGDYILMLNNDIELTNDDWLHEMMSWSIQPEVGCVGAKLWYPNRTLQHGGVILGVNGVAGHAHRGISMVDNGYIGRAAVHQNLSAVTGACMLVKRSIYEQVGGLDEQFAVAYNDIDFCLRVVAAGYSNVWTPYAEMVHHESATRGIDSFGSGRVRLQKEVDLMRERWGALLMNDPAYSCHLSRSQEDFSIHIA